MPGKRLPTSLVAKDNNNQSSQIFAHANICANLNHIQKYLSICIMSPDGYWIGIICPQYTYIPAKRGVYAGYDEEDARPLHTQIQQVQSGRIGENRLLSDNPILSCVQYSTERNCFVPKILFCDVFFRGKYLIVAASITCHIVVLHEYCIANMAPMLQITRRTSLFFSSSLSLAGITNEGLHNLTLRWYSHNLTLRWYSYCYTVPKSLFSVLSP